MLKKVSWITLPIFLMTVCLCFSSSQQDHNPPIPPDVTIEVPDPSLPIQVKSLLGKWVGQWTSWKSRWGWDSVVYVEKVEKDSARVVFAWGEYNTSMGSCHCNPNWVRVQNAKIKYSDESATLEFYTPKLRPAWLKISHTVTGSADEVFGVNDRSSGRYSYQFIVDKDDPTVMKGGFSSAKASPLSIKMKKVDQDKKSEF
jgi:hypothetical protein